MAGEVGYEKSVDAAIAGNDLRAGLGSFSNHPDLSIS
jgi:hypothetical protein